MQTILKIAFGLNADIVQKEALVTDSEIYKRALAVMNEVNPSSYMDDFFFNLFQLLPEAVSLVIKQYEQGLTGKAYSNNTLFCIKWLS